MPRRTHPRNSKRKQLAHALWESSLDGSLFCPCGKMSGRTEQEAWDIAMGIYHSRPDGDMPQRVYECNVTPGAYHWTRRP